MCNGFTNEESLAMDYAKAIGILMVVLGHMPTWFVYVLNP